MFVVGERNPVMSLSLHRTGKIESICINLPFVGLCNASNCALEWIPLLLLVVIFIKDPHSRCNLEAAN